MALDGLAMGFLAREANAQLAGARVDKISQPDSDLLVIHLRSPGSSVRLLLCATPGYARVHLTEKSYENPPEAPMFCMLARKHLAGGRLMEISQLYSDRLLLLRFLAVSELGDPRETLLYFEAMGKHSNLTMVQDGRILDALRHVTLEMSRVRQMLPGLPFVMPPRQDKLAGDEVTSEKLLARMSAFDGPLHRFLFNHLAGVGADSARELALRLSGSAETPLTPENRAGLSQALAELLRNLPSLAAPCLLSLPDGTPEQALPFPFLSFPRELQQPMATLSQTVETLYFERDLRNRFTQRVQGLRRALGQARERAENKLAMLEEDLLSHEETEQLRVSGELLTASLHLVPKGAEAVTLPDWYTGGEKTIPLDVSQSPAQNAQRYFKRYRKALTARRLAGEQKQKALADIGALDEALYFLEEARTAQEISEIRAQAAEMGLLRRESAAGGKRKESPSKPLSFLSDEGFAILVGRNGAQNERLLKDARGDDLWLHAKDIPGSHVIIKTEGRQAPPATIRLAAGLASYYSKARGRQVQVDCTKRKLVRKTPGGAPGLVHYTGEKSLLASLSEGELEKVPRA